MALFKTESLPDKNQKALAAAKDILWMLNKKEIVASPGVCVRAPVNRPVSKNEELREVLKEAQVCEACAVGSMFLAVSRVFDSQKAGKSFAANNRIGMDEAVPVLKIAFSDKQIQLIEYTFELGNGYYTGDSATLLNATDKSQALQFGRQWRKDPAERLKAICRNVIANDGAFVPYDIDSGY